MSRRLAVLPAAVFVLLSALPAFGQVAGQDRTTLGSKQGAQTFSVKGKLALFTGIGLDLDVIGDISAGAIGVVRGTQTLIQPAAYPDVYVKAQRRRYLGASFGITKKTEVMARYQDANNPAANLLLGAYGSNTNEFSVQIDDYKDKMVEFGLRHYFATPKRTREYFSLLYGLKTVEPIGLTMRVPGGDVVAAMYSKSKIPSLAFELGISLEYGHLGVFLESGFRWQRRLDRDDTDLAKYDLTDLNNTAPRIFMPAILGLHFRF